MNTVTDEERENLTPEESKELSQLLFRCYTDLPFAPSDYVRMQELEMKAGNI